MSPHETVDITIGFNLHNMRKQRGLTQENLGKSTGLSKQQISKYENGHDAISCTKLVEFSQVLKVKLLDFFDGVPHVGQ